MLREMIQFLRQMPTDTKTFLTMALLGLAGTLIVLKWLMQPLVYSASAVVRRFTHQGADRSVRKFLGHKPRLF
jgi:hypothetical protein